MVEPCLSESEKNQRADRRRPGGIPMRKEKGSFYEALGEAGRYG